MVSQWTYQSPQMMWLSPENVSNATTAAVNFSLLANSTVTTNLACELYVNGSANDAAYGNGTLFTMQTLSDGTLARAQFFQPVRKLIAIQGCIRGILSRP
jgi:hypothetical protein